MSVLVSPAGMHSSTWRALLAEELAALHAACVQATTYGVERVSYWPASYEPEWAGELVTPDEAAERGG